MFFREGNVVLKFENGKDFILESFEKNGFNRLIFIVDKEGLGMVVFDKNFSVMDVERCVGMYCIFGCVFWEGNYLLFVKNIGSSILVYFLFFW